MARLVHHLLLVGLIALLIESAAHAVSPHFDVPSTTVIGNRPSHIESPVVVEYAKDVAPLLAKHCVSCHGPKKQESELRLDSIEAMLQGGKKGPAIVPGKGATSRLILALRGEGGLRLMPPDAPDLKPAEIELFKRWIDQQVATPK
jgi:hypothetical protein